jgi:hypothetical protein
MDAIPRRWSGPVRPQAVRRPQNPGNARQRYEQYLARAGEAQPNKRRTVVVFSVFVACGRRLGGIWGVAWSRDEAPPVSLDDACPHLWPPRGNALRLENTGWWPDQKRGATRQDFYCGKPADAANAALSKIRRRVWVPVG